ncbi:hypothetical protein BDZ97DRAFT_1064860 [Flammula alnicola]|nr:hypothetical protein BDZ97DRAFT_1064860 [Flammula alnicola]
MLVGKLQLIPGCTDVLLPGMEAVLLKDESSTPLHVPALSSSSSSSSSLNSTTASALSTSTGPAGCKLNEGELWLRSANVRGRVVEDGRSV